MAREVQGTCRHPPQEHSPAELPWLMGDVAQGWLARFQDEPLDPLQLQTLLRHHLEPWQARLISQQADLRRRGARKFSLARRMLFQPRALEQATDETLARYKSRRFPAGRVVDLCCGLGGDLIGLAPGRSGVGVETDPSVAALCRWNLGVYGQADCTILCQAAETCHLARADAWHVDPDRRPGGQRTVHPARMRPDLETLHRMLRRLPHAAIQLAPASPDVPWPVPSVREWLGHHGECQQQIVWAGDLAGQAAPRRATLLDGQGTPHGIDGDGTERIETVDSPGKWIFEPAAPVLAAGLVACLARRHRLEQLGGPGGYLTGDEPLESPLLAAFEVLEAVPGRWSAIRAAVERYGPGHLEIKKRGVAWESKRPLIARRSATGPALTLLLTGDGRRRQAIVARRPVP